MNRLVFSLCLAVSFLAADFDKAGTSSATFLKIPAGARSVAMGTAVTASINDGSAVYWNPAGLVLSQGRTVSFNHYPYILDITSNLVSASLPVTANTVIGISVFSMSTEKQEITTVQQEDGTGIFYQVSDIAFGLSLAQRLTDRLVYGLSVKYVRLNAHHENADALAFDIGSILHTGMKGLSIGMALSNFGTEIQYSGSDLLGDMDRYPYSSSNYPEAAYSATQSWPLPMTIRIGLAMDILGKSSKEPLISSGVHSLLAEIDALHPNDNSEQVNFGLEYGWKDLLFLRTGYQYMSDIYGFTAGTGLHYALNGETSVYLDYAWVPKAYFGTSSMLSLNISF